MHREDFIKKAIRHFAQVIYKVLGLVDIHRHDEALAEIDASREELLGLDSNLINLLSEKDMIDLLTIGDEIQAEKLLILAELFKIEGDIYSNRSNHDQSDSLYTKALNLLLEISALTGVPEFSDEFSSIEEIDDLIENELSQETQANLFFYYDDAGKFAFAADTLLEFVETYPEETTMIEEGKTFFEKLNALSDEALEAVGLTREKVLEGAEELIRGGP